MKPISAFLRVSATLGVAALISACNDTLPAHLGPVPIDPLFQSYVALGNSITAGYQSGGITDSTQRESYAHLLAQAMHTRYAYASLTNPGCPPPIDNFQTQGRPGGATDATCNLRSPSSVTTALNNVAVPGATSLDPTSVSTAASNPLTQFILGGKTQAARAADARPTFASVWIGNNDVLIPALSGLLTPVPNISPGVTSETDFETNYSAMINQLRTIPSLRGGVLIGVIQVAAAPILFPAQALFNPAFKAGFDAFAGQPTTILPSCTLSTTSLISFRIVSAIRSGDHPPVIGCEKNSVPTTAVGDIFVLDATEQATLAANISRYNSYIQSVANSLGWAYYDPNPRLLTFKTSTPPCINPVLNLASATQPFGPCVSLDGVHPTAMAHQAIANDLIGVINAKYGTTLAPAP